MDVVYRRERIARPNDEAVERYREARGWERTCLPRQAFRVATGFGSCLLFLLRTI
jgi:hypothetical protein